ncbi:iron chelate uptake ABC transporter family permease subunit [Niallia sp. Krafla_26]|uniref:iron chelate uptake ABC transporter family permease subunit n=1 Tax=Niallia sp. Krafla_26 TaxID=3064703 RepID=UPI003D184504
MRNWNWIKIGILAVVAVALIAIFLFTDVRGSWDYVLGKRTEKVLAMVLTGAAIALSTIVFQTITNNKILTPSIIGLDQLYMLIQTVLVFAFGATLTSTSKSINFFISIGLMIMFVGVLYKIIFKREGNNIYFLLLVGIIFGTLFQSLSTFMQVLIDPNEFMMIQDKMFASFNNINGDLLLLSAIVILLTSLYFIRYFKYLDVLSLGKEQAINLGVDFDKIVKRLLVVVAILISVSTALVGPITFLGLLVVNVTYQLFKTFRHSFLIFGSILISIISLVGGQFIVERVFTFSTTLSVIVNFIGGVYFIYLLLKQRKA